VIQITNFKFEYHFLKTNQMQQTSRDEILVGTLRSCETIGKNAARYFAELRDHAANLKKDFIFQRNAEIFIALGNSDRLLILELLQQQDRCVCELEIALKKSQPAISRDLRILEQAKLIHGWKKGKFTFYSININTFKTILAASTNWVNNITNTITIQTRET
jgi:ArsR family transcriptional regulator